MKKLLLPLLAVFALSVGTAAAQTTTPDQAPMAQGRPMHSPADMAAHQTERMTKALGLSADQAAKVQAILTQRGQDMQNMRGQREAGASRDQLRDQMQANRTKYDDQLKAVLTPDQFTKYTAMQEQRRHHGPGMNGPVDGKIKAKDGKVKIKES